MNKAKRSQLRKAQALLTDATNIVSGVCWEEQAALDNLPEGLQDSEQSQKMDEAIDAMEDAIESIGDAINSLDGAMK